MARADAASASARSDSIKGLAQSIAKPAYRRLLTAEPALRRAVPVLIIAFLLTIGVGAVVQVLDHRRRRSPKPCDDIDDIADFVAERLDRLASAEKRRRRRARDLLERALPTRATARGRRILLTNADGVVTATAPPDGADRPAPDRRARRRAAADHLRRQRRRAGNHARRRQPRASPPCARSTPPRPGRRRPAARRCARGLALRHHADRHAVGDHRLRPADPRLRLPLAGDARARGRRDLRHRAQPHRHRAQSRPLRPVGLGPRARPHLLVAFDVRHPRPRRRATTC